MSKKKRPTKAMVMRPAQQPAALALMIDEALALLAERPGQEDVAPHPAAPLPSLLERCEALLSQPRRIADPPLRILYHLPGTEGRTLAAWLRLVPNTVVLQGFDPANDAQMPRPPSSLAALLPQPNPLGVPVSDRAWSDTVAAALHSLRAALNREGRHLVITCEIGRDRPALDRLLADQGALLPLLLVRHPLAAFAAAEPAASEPPQGLEALCATWLDLLTAHPDLPVLQQEAAEGDLMAMLDGICRQLDLPAPPDAEAFAMAEMPEPANGPDAAPLPLPAALAAEDLRDGAIYRKLCARLGYDPGMPPDPAGGTRRPALALPGPLSGPDLATPAGFRRDWSAFLPQDRMIITCHHKSGTNFLRKVFQEISATFDLPLWMKFYEAEPDPGAQSPAWQICFHQHGRVKELLPAANFRGIHCLRHPKSLIYSAALYHQICKEPWVDVPLNRFTSATFWALSDRDIYNRIKDPKTAPEERQRLLAEAKTQESAFTRFDSNVDFAGRSYRQMLTEATSVSAKLLFEMRAFSRGVILDMLQFPKDVRFATLSLETISHDPQMLALRRAFLHLGFQGPALQKCLDIALPHCLWSSDALPAHATTGVSEDWRQHFTGPVETEYRRLYGWTEQALGYVV